MTERNVYCIPDYAGNRNSIDPALLLALNNGGGFGGNGNWMWIFFLFFLEPLMRNGMFGFGNGFGGGFGNGFGGFGNGTGYLSNMLNNDMGRELVTQAVNRGVDTTQQLASMLNCDVESIKTALNALTSQICAVGNQIGLGQKDTINSIERGDASITQKFMECCCENRLAICQQTNTLQNSIKDVAIGQERGFSSVAYETQKQTCDLQGSIKELGTQIANQFCALKESAMSDKIDALREKNSVLTTQLNLEHQNAVTAATVNQAIAPVVGALGSIQKEVDAIKCAQPSTTTIQYSPVVGVPACVAAQYGLGAGYGYGYGYNNGFWG